MVFCRQVQRTTISDMRSLFISSMKNFDDFDVYFLFFIKKNTVLSLKNYSFVKEILFIFTLLNRPLAVF
ncbi:MAG: hypothetical protein RM338_08735 [Nostoc sp. DedQUE12a]|nr:hypothetical protein [Nostoc sp. DedQUE12a]